MSMVLQSPASETTDPSRKTATVDEVLAWAYGRELIRVERGALASAIERDRQIVRSCGEDPMERMRDTGLLVDVSPNAYGVIPDLTDDRPPHADALLVAAEVAALDAVTVDDLAGVDFLGEPTLAGLTERERQGAHEDGAAMALDGDGRLARTRLSTLVVAGAVLGRHRRDAPPFTGRLERRFVERHGRALWFREVARAEGEGREPVIVEIDGFDPASRRPFPGAYRKEALFDADDPDAAGPVNLGRIVADRIEWQVWRMALDMLAAALDGRLERFSVVPSLAPRWPWEGEESPAEARILPSLEKMVRGASRARLTCDGNLA